MTKQKRTQRQIILDLIEVMLKPSVAMAVTGVFAAISLMGQTGEALCSPLGCVMC